MTEAELAQKFMNHYSDFDIYPEVPAGGIIDIVVNTPPVLIAIEVKKSLNLEVIGQAVKNKEYAHYSYVAVPAAKGRYFAETLCKKLGIGLLVYRAELRPWSKHGDKDWVEERVPAALNRKIRRPKLEEWMKRSIAGSQSDRMTAFKYFSEELVTMVKRYGPMPIKKLFEDTPRHYRTFSSFRSCVTGYIRSGVIKGLEIENGIVKIKSIKDEYGSI